MGLIYLITCTINSKQYVGITTQNSINRRLYRHFNGTGNGPLYEDLKKYGRDAFTIEILEENVFNELLHELEKLYIANLNTAHPDGYNIIVDGRQPSPSQPTREKISASLKGRKQSKDHVEKRANARRGKRWSSEARESFSIKQTGRALSEDHKRSISEGLFDKVPSGENHPNFGKIARNRRPEFMHAHETFLSLPPNMDIKEKKQILRNKFPDIPYTTITRWICKWDPESYTPSKAITPPNKSPYKESIQDFFKALPIDMDISQKRLLLRRKFRGLVKYNTMYKWTSHWQSELESNQKE